MKPPRAVGCERILVLDDNPDMLASMRDLLELAGATVATATSTSEADQILDSGFEPSVFLIDIHPNDSHSKAYVERLCSDPRYTGVPVVAMSGDVRELRRLDIADRKLLKPFAPERLFEALQELCGASTDSDSNERGAEEQKTAVPPSELATGHAHIDAHHAKMLAQLRSMHRAGPEEIAAVVSYLRESLSSHFTYEEALMCHVGYPRAEIHRQEHLSFFDRFVHLKARLERDRGTHESPTAFVAAVEKWVTEHVLGEDRTLADYVRARAAHR